MMGFIGIEQEKIMGDSSLKSLDLVDIAILNCMRTLAAYDSKNHVAIGENYWKYAPWWNVLEAIPLLRKPNGKPWEIKDITNRLKKMEKCGAIHSLNIEGANYYMFYWGKVSPPEPDKPLKGKRKAVYDRDGHKCLKCGKTGSLVMDHVLPLAKGGNSKICNLQTLCGKCNGDKGTQYIDYREVKIPIEQLYIASPTEIAKP